MGAWGVGIKQNDTTLDAIDFYKTCLKRDMTLSDGFDAVQEHFDEELSGPSEAPFVWHAIAEVQWTYGTVSDLVLDTIRDHCRTDSGMELWLEEGPGIADDRRTAIKKFLTKIESPNPRPSKLPRLVVRPPKFSPGDCLSIQIDDELHGTLYAASFVVATDHSDLEHGQDFIVDLDFLSTNPPTRTVFESRLWLYRNHDSWDNELSIAWYGSTGFRSVKKQLDLVASIDVLPSDPKPRTTLPGDFFTAWSNLGRAIIKQRLSETASAGIRLDEE